MCNENLRSRHQREGNAERPSVTASDAEKAHTKATENDWKKCVICSAKTDFGVGVQVYGQREDGSNLLYLATDASCGSHIHAAMRHAVKEHLDQVQDSPWVVVLSSRIAHEDRERWLIDEVLEVIPDDGPSREDLESVGVMASSSITAFEGVLTDE